MLHRNRDALLGPVHGGGRNTRIMVTMPSEAATDPDLIPALGAAGMDIARVNCAHDDAAAWQQMIDRVRALPDGGPGGDGSGRPEVADRSVDGGGRGYAGSGPSAMTSAKWSGRRGSSSATPICR